MNKQSMFHVFLMSMLLVSGSLSVRAAAPAPAATEGVFDRMRNAAGNIFGFVNDYNKVHAGAEQMKKDGENIEKELNGLKIEGHGLWDSLAYSSWFKTGCFGMAACLGLTAMGTYDKAVSPLNNLGSIGSGFASLVAGAFALYLYDTYPTEKKPVTKLEKLAQIQARHKQLKAELQAAGDGVDEEYQAKLDELNALADQLDEMKREKDGQARATVHNVRGGGRNVRGRNARGGAARGGAHRVTPRARRANGRGGACTNGNCTNCQ